MRKRTTLTWLALVAALALYGCNSGGDGAQAQAPRSTTSASSVFNGAGAPEPAAEPGEPDDASGGKVLWAKWLTGLDPWVAQFYNDTNNTGKVSYCVYDLKDGYEAQGLPLWEYTVTVPPGTAYGDIQANIYDVMPKEWCSDDDLRFQADLIRGGVCGVAPNGHGGYQFTATAGTIKRPCECQPGEWEEVSRTTTPVDPEEGWGSCDQFPETSDVRVAACYECREVSIEIVESNGCDKRTTIEEKIERREAPCPTCEDFETPEVDLTWSIVTQEDKDGLLAVGHKCDAKYDGIIKPSICAPPFDIDPTLPLLVKWETTQLFTFSWSGTFTPEGTRLQCPMSLKATDTVDPGEEPCKPWYPGTLPDRGKGRITFMSKLPTGEYLWRIQNNTGFDTLTVKGPGLERTFEVPSGTITAFTTAGPHYGVSLYLCDGTKVHGTASANETVENWCDYPEALEGECPSGSCFYNLNEVVGGQEACFESPGYVSWNEQNHLCELLFPGVSLKGWNLNPGQSAEGCLSKHDD